MDDRYLFKAKRADNGEWVTGYYTKSIVNGSVFGYIRESIFGTDIKIMLNTLCQYTGLKDKNGKLIWENDIVKRKFRLFSGEAKYEEKENCGVVKYDESYARFGYQCSVFAMLRESEKYDSLEVIGNISDNPELLEVGE